MVSLLAPQNFRPLSVTSKAHKNGVILGDEETDAHYAQMAAELAAEKWDGPNRIPTTLEDRASILVRAMLLERAAIERAFRDMRRTP